MQNKSVGISSNLEIESVISLIRECNKFKMTHCVISDRNSPVWNYCTKNKIVVVDQTNINMFRFLNIKHIVCYDKLVSFKLDKYFKLIKINVCTNKRLDLKTFESQYQNSIDNENTSGVSVFWIDGGKEIYSSSIPLYKFDDVKFLRSKLSNMLNRWVPNLIVQVLNGNRI